MKYLVEKSLIGRDSLTRKRPVVLVCGNTDIVSPQDLFIEAVKEVVEEIKSVGGIVTTTDQLGVDGMVREMCDDMGVPVMVRKCSSLMLMDYSAIDQRVNQMYNMYADIGSDAFFPITIVDQYRNQANFTGEHIRVVVKKRSFSVMDVIRTGRTSGFHTREKLDQPTTSYVTTTNSQEPDWANVQWVNNTQVAEDAIHRHYTQGIDPVEDMPFNPYPTSIPHGKGIMNHVANSTINSYVYNNDLSIEKLAGIAKEIYKINYK